MTSPAYLREFSGLSTDEAKRRAARGLANELPARSGRSVGQIIRANVFTRINALLGVLFILVLSTGSFINCAFGLLIIANSIIGIIQELRAKHTLDSLAVVGEAHPQVIRDGTLMQVIQEEIVVGDYIVLSPGEQAIVDGRVVAHAYLEMDESLLTGESDPIAKHEGDDIFSGSYVSSGSGLYEATHVGNDSHAAKLQAQASKFSLVHSELNSGINSILRVITWILVPLGILTIWGQLRLGEHDYVSIILAVSGALVPMIPEGLVLITSTAFALGVIRVGKRKCLVNELPAIEGLARVDVVCADKTGTLTENTLDFSHDEFFPTPHNNIHDNKENSEEENTLRHALRLLIVHDPAPNSTMKALSSAIVVQGSATGALSMPNDISPSQVLAFTSAKKYMGMKFEPSLCGAWLLGAPDILLEPSSPIAQRAKELGDSGLRVLVFSHFPTLSDLQSPLTSRACSGLLCVFHQRIRPDAAATLDYFASQGVHVKVISGDNAASVGAVVSSLGMDAGTPIDAREIPAADFDRVVEENHVFGRVTPDQKRAMVAALQKNGHTVAMTGDGVNDVLALKDSDLGVAMGSGTPATRAVAKIVLLDDRFATLPYVVGEGRRVLANIERVANLFLTKTIYSSFLAIFVLLFSLPFPFQPIHVTITGWFTIGIPAFLLSLPPNNQRASPHFVRRVLRFGIPSGLIVAVCAMSAYLFARSQHVSQTQGSTAALASLIIASTWVLSCVARPYRPWKIALIFLPLLAYGAIFTLPLTQRLFLLDSSHTPLMLIAGAIGCAGALLIELIWWVNRASSRAHHHLPLQPSRKLN